MALEDYKDIVGAAAGLVTFAQMFSGVFLCKDIYKSGSTNKIPVMPFLGGFVISILFYQHGLLLNDTAMKTVNIGGIALNISYLLFYYFWTQNNNKPKFYKDICKGAALVICLLLYVQIEDAKKVEFRFGMIVTVLLMFLIASPLFSLGEVIKTRSTESLPFPMIISGFINVVGSLLCLIQLSLFVIFPSKPKKDKKVK